MSIQGVVTNGTTVLENGVKLPDGTRVEIVVKPEPAESESSLATLLKYAGAVKDLPADMARNHDHYLHEVRKQ